MKSTILILFFCIFNTLSAQNWQPFIVGDTYYYHTDTSETISAAFRIESYSVIAGDTVGNLNAILGPADAELCRPLVNQFWLGSIFESATGVFEFNEPGTRVLHTQATTGFSWTFDLDLMITAEIANTDTMTVFGSSDSIKIILLSTGDIITLSKNHGLLGFPSDISPGAIALQLSGIGGRDIGNRLPDFGDYFNWSAGDMFQWQVTYLANSEASWESNVTTYKFTILSAEVSDTLLVADIQGIKMFAHYESYSPNNFSSVDTIEETIILRADEHSFATSLPGQFVPLKIDIQDILTQNIAGVDIYKAYIYDSIGILTLADKFVDSIDGGTTALYQTVDLLCDEPFIESYLIAYKVGLGCTSWHQGGVETKQTFELTAYRKDGDTVGVFLADSDFVASVTEKTLMPIHLYPNPSSQYITCELPFPASANAYYQIFDMQGNRIAQQSISQSTFNINLEMFPNALYNLVVMDGKYQYTKRFMKSKG